MSAEPAIAAVDWGTSSLRVWLLDGAGAVLDERRSAEGMTTARETGFPLILERLLGEMHASAYLPAIVCGMAGARQGWVEAPYADAPCALADIFRQNVAAPGIDRDVRILPGLAQRDPARPDVLRGEETQLAGALGNDTRGVLACMPGTHSKWVEADGDRVLGFSTWMTGEAFKVLSEQTILAHSTGGADARVDAASPDFAAGVNQGFAAPDRLLSLTFGLRAGTLLHGLAQPEAAARLSGLMIGAEIAAARRLYPERETMLIASGALRRLYEAAFAGCGIEVQTVDADEAVRAGLIQAARTIGLVG